MSLVPPYPTPPSPPIPIGVYDMDVSPSAIFRHPQLYRACIKNEFFQVSTAFITVRSMYNTHHPSRPTSPTPPHLTPPAPPFYPQSHSFWLTILEAVLESVLLSVLPLYFLEHSQPHTLTLHTPTPTPTHIYTHSDRDIHTLTHTNKTKKHSHVHVRRVPF